MGVGVWEAGSPHTPHHPVRAAEGASRQGPWPGAMPAPGPVGSAAAPEGHLTLERPSHLCRPDHLAGPGMDGGHDRAAGQSHAMPGASCGCSPPDPPPSPSPPPGPDRSLGFRDAMQRPQGRHLSGSLWGNAGREEPVTTAPGAAQT